MVSPDLKGWLVSERGGRAVDELLSLTIEAGSQGTTVSVAGEIDLLTAPSLRRCLDSIAGDVVVDLTEVPFVDSQAIGLLVAEHKRRVAAGEHLVVSGSSAMALRSFKITGVDQLLDLHGDSAGPATKPAWSKGSRAEPTAL
jgi:anti-sigma B factor antagonist